LKYCPSNPWGVAILGAYLSSFKGEEEHEGASTDIYIPNLFGTTIF